MAADLFETYAVTVVATMVLASIFFAGQSGPRLGGHLSAGHRRPFASSRRSPAPISSSSATTTPKSSKTFGPYFKKLGIDDSIMGALYKGLIAAGVLSIAGLFLATTFTVGWGEIGKVEWRGDPRLRPVSIAVCSAWS